MIKAIFSTTYTGKRQQRPWRIDVIDTAYTGDPDADPLPLGDVDAQGAIIKWGNDRDLYEPIVASSMDVDLYLTGAAKTWATQTLPLTQEFRYFVDIYENNVLFWRGVILTDAVQFYETPDPLQFRLSAICGLGRLQQFEYKEIIDPTLLSGSQGQLLTEIMKCLKFATVEPALYSNTVPFLRTNFQWYETNMDSTVGGIDPVQLISYNTENTAFFTDIDTGDVKYTSIFEYLRQILMNFGLSITYANGAWQLFQVNQLMGTATTVRYYEYAVNYKAFFNPTSNTGTQVGAYVSTNIQKNVGQNKLSKANLYPLRGVLNSFKAPFSEITTEPLFDFSLIVYRNPAIDITPVAISENYNLSGTFGFRVNVQTDVTLDGSSLSNPIVVRVEGQMRLSITDGSTTRYLTATGAWSATNQTFSIGFDTDQILNGQIRTFALGVVINSAPLPFAGVVTFQAVNVTATQLPNNVGQNSLITARISDVTIEHYDTTGAGSIRREFYTVTNQTAGVQSSIKALLRLPLFDRATRYTQNAVFIWRQSTAARVHSQLWRKNDVGGFFTIHILVLREALLRRQLPAKMKEGVYIGFVAPNEKVKDEAANWAVVSSEFSTGFDQMNRLLIQNLGADVFTVNPVPSDRTVLDNLSGVATGGNRTSGNTNTLVTLGQSLEPIAAGTASTITLPNLTIFPITAGTPLIILDLITGLPVTVTVKNDVDAGSDSIEVNEVVIGQPIVAPYLFFPQLTLLN